MTVSSRALVELILLGPTNDRRQLQDSPVLGDVWIAFAAKPSEPMDLLITPSKDCPAGPVAVLIAKQIERTGIRHAEGQEAQVAYLQGLVAARLFFEEVLRVIVPMTVWWRDQKVLQELEAYPKGDRLRKRVKSVLSWAQATNEDAQADLAQSFADFTALDRFVILSGIILWGAGRSRDHKQSLVDSLMRAKQPASLIKTVRELVTQFLKDNRRESPGPSPQLWQISMNRRAMPALAKSVPAVKGDAARTLFNVRCDNIRWAILDSGIDGTHDVFKDKKGQCRIIKAFDFRDIRKIVSLENLNSKSLRLRARELLGSGNVNLTLRQATDILNQLAQDAENDRPIHWELVENFIRIDPSTPPRGGHGTHVAGILGAYSGFAKRRINTPADGGDTAMDEDSGMVDGMCPDIKFYDFRVLAKTAQDTEFAIIAALQYLRYLNERHSYLSIHGANLSLSIPHDVRNFACGRTPLCNECERLVESGVVVVAAAGNFGYRRFETTEGSYEGYNAFSITDPGNADGVITVGATHRYRPHTYGVSFFSSRGPTGDGRLKPDLVAPGERIQSCLPEGSWGEMDGTSMAAPHVSGAAAMLMARYAELIGSPRRIKQILCESATDLGRERSFQGHGMLDVLRAFQKI